MYYRGQDIFYWIKNAGFYTVRAEDLEDPRMLDLIPPHVSGTRKFPILFGIIEDAEYIVDKMCEHSKPNLPSKISG